MSKKSLIRTTILLLALLSMICAAGCNQTDSADSPDSQTEISQTSQTSRTGSSDEPAESNNDDKFNTDGDWPLFRGNTRSQGVATSGLPNQLEVIWKHEIKGGAFEGSAIIVAAPDKLAIVGDADGKLLAFDLETGEIKWDFVVGDIGFVTAPAFRNDKIYIGDMDGKFHCLSIAGEKLWDFATDNSIDSSANFHNDLVIFGSRDAKLYALNAETGELAWKLETDDQVRCSITIVDGRAFVAGCDGALHIINVDDGTEVGNVVIESPTGVTPAALGNQIFVGSENTGYLGIDWQEADINWRFDGENGSVSTRSSPAVTTDHVVFGSRDRIVYSVQPQTGHLNWSTELKSDIDSSPVIVGNRVFVGSTDGRFYELELETGKIVWQTEFYGPILSSPAVGFGRLVIATNRGVVYCLGKPNKPK